MDDRSPADYRPRVFEYLDNHQVMTLSTCSNNVPWAAAVFYASRGFTFYFLSDPKSRHLVNIRQNARVSIAVHEDYRDWPEIKGVQAEGRADIVPLIEMPGAMGIYMAKFPFIRNMVKSPEGIFQIGGKLVTARLWRVTCDKVRWLDNAAGFSFRVEVPENGP